MAAGVIKVKNGHLTSLSPLSGHYRAGTAEFKGFVDRLEEAGTDMSKYVSHEIPCEKRCGWIDFSRRRVSISKSLATIGALEKYAKFSKKKKALKQSIVKSFRAKEGKETDDRSPQEKEDDRLNHRVESDRQKEKRLPGMVAQDAGTTERANLEREKRGAGPSALPYEGMKMEDMTYEQRIERGASVSYLFSLLLA